MIEYTKYYKRLDKLFSEKTETNTSVTIDCVNINTLPSRHIVNIFGDFGQDVFSAWLKKRYPRKKCVFNYSNGYECYSNGVKTESLFRRT